MLCVEYCLRVLVSDNCFAGGGGGGGRGCEIYEGVSSSLVLLLRWRYEEVMHSDGGNVSMLLCTEGVARAESVLLASVCRVCAASVAEYGVCRACAVLPYVEAMPARLLSSWMISPTVVLMCAAFGGVKGSV